MSNIETQLLGSCLCYGEESATIAWVAGLEAKHFTDPVHRSLWMMIEAELKSSKFDISKVTTSFTREVKIVAMMADPILPSSVKYFAEAIIDKARDAIIDDTLVSIHTLIKNKGDFEGPEITNQALERLIKLIYETSSAPKKVSAQDAYRMMGELWEKQEKEGYRNDVVATGFRSLDEVLNGGVRRGGVFTIAAQTGVGKSIKALNFALKAAIAGVKVMYVTVELDAMESFSRIVAAQSGGNYAKILGGPRGQDEKECYDNSWRDILKTKIDVVELEKPYIEDVEQLIRYEKIHAPHDLIIIDYIGQFKTKEKYFSRAEMIGAISSFTKLQIAKKHNVAVILVAQMNRNTEAEGHSGFRLGNIADAASIERDSDIVALLFREDKNQPTDEAIKSGLDIDRLAWLKIKKHRHGQNNISIPLRFNGNSARFEEISEQELKQAEWNKANYVAPSKPRPKFQMTEAEKQANNRRYGDDF